MSTTRSSTRLDIQALRALAVMLVVAYHAHLPGLPGGYVGVDVFYVISGFLITGLLLGELRDTGTVDLLSFYARRARRLLPAASLVLGATLAASWLLLPPLRLAQVGRDAVAAALGVANVNFAVQATDYLQVGAAPSPFLHFWSLAVEEQFYLLWPALLFLASRRLGSQGHLYRRAAAAIGAVFVLSLTASVVLTGHWDAWAFYTPLTRGFELALGGLVAVAAPRLNLPTRVRSGCVAAGAVLMVAAVVCFDDTTAMPGWAALVPTAGAALFLAGGTGSPIGERLWSPKPVQRLGRLSYSLYLWHWPALVLPAAWLGRDLSGTERLVAVVGAVVLAELTYRYVEDPLRRAALLSTRTRGLAVGLALALASAGGGLGLPLAAAHAGTAPATAASVPADLVPALSAAAADFPASQHDGCNTTVATAGRCLYGDLAGHTTIALFGDSHAAQWLPALQRLAGPRHWRILAMVKSGCPAAQITVTKFNTPVRYTECDQWRETAFRRIRDAHPALVIVSSLHRYVPAAGGPADPAWRAGLTRTLQRLAPARVLLLADTPFPKTSVPECLSAHLDNRHACDLPARTAFARDRRALERAVAASAGARFADPTGWVCPAVPCQVIAGRYLVYRDASHISTPFAASLAPQLLRAIGPLRP